MKLKSDTCLAAVFVGAGTPLDLREFPVPSLEPGEALVRVECCTLCGSDLHTLTGARSEPAPSILGHEILGIVEQMGDPPPCDLGGSPLRPGDRITWSTTISCGSCDRCRHGFPQKCRTLAKYGHELAEGRLALSGGLAELLLLRRGSAVVRISPDLPAEVICPVSCATATVAGAFRVAGAVAGRRVLILGAGMLGLTAAAFAKVHGASAVVICDVDARRLARAADFGTDGGLQWPPQPLERQFDAVLEMSGSPEAVELAVKCGDVGARMVLVGSVKTSRPIQLDPEALVRRCQSVHGLHNYVPTDLQSAVKFLEESGSTFPFAGLVEATYPLTEVNAAVQRAINGRPFRVAIRP
jgi:putative phosphonate catabolism associated alcohol dehydrogenase